MNNDRTVELFRVFLAEFLAVEKVQDSLVEKVWASASEEEKKNFADYTLRTMRGHVQVHVDRELNAKKWYVGTRVRAIVEEAMQKLDSVVKEKAEKYITDNLDTQIMKIVHETVNKHLATLQRRILGR